MASRDVGPVVVASITVVWLINHIVELFITDVPPHTVPAVDTSYKTSAVFVLR